MDILGLILGLVIFIACMILLQKKLGISDRDINLMVTGFILFNFISKLIVLIMSIFTGTFLVVFAASAFGLLIDGALSWYFLSRNGYDVLDLFR